jgi:hypothetical protein
MRKQIKAAATVLLIIHGVRGLRSRYRGQARYHARQHSLSLRNQEKLVEEVVDEYVRTRPCGSAISGATGAFLRRRRADVEFTVALCQIQSGAETGRSWCLISRMRLEAVH